MALTVTPTAVNIVTDSMFKPSVTLTLADNTGALGNTLYIAALTDANGNPAGTASSGTTKTDGTAAVLLMPTKPDATLTLTLTAAGESATVTVSSSLIKPIIVTSDTALISAGPAAATFSATLKTLADTAVSDKVTLSWTAGADSTSKAFFPPKTDTGDGTKTVFSAPTDNLQDSDIEQNLGAQITATLTVTTSDQTGGPSSSGSVQVGYLEAPVLDLGYATSTISDDIIEAYSEKGIPWYIPPVANASPGDNITLFASNTANSVFTLGYGPIVGGTVPTIIFSGTDNGAFQANDELLVYYTVHNLNYPQIATLSKNTPISVIRKNPPQDSGDPRLTQLTLDHYIYTTANFAQQDTVTATVDFKGTYRPAVGDRITVHMDLAGYTSANLNHAKSIVLDSYTLVDAAQDLTLVFPSDITGTGNGLTYDKLSGIDGSNGTTYYTIEKPIEGSGGQYGAPIRSPARNVIVDTVDPYSGNAMARSISQWRKIG